MTDFFSHNVECLKNGSHAAIIRDGGVVRRMKAFGASRTGRPTLSIALDGRELLIHSKYDPETEARRWVDSCGVQDDITHILMLGFGLGYHVEALLEKCPQLETLIVIEPNGDIFRAALMCRDLSGVISDKRLRIIAGAYADISRHVFNTVTAYSTGIAGENRKVLIHAPSLEALSPDEVEMKEIFLFIDAARADRSVFVEKKRENREINSSAYSEAMGVLSLKGAFEGQPVIVAASGPSLDQSLKVLSGIKTCPPIIAVDSAFAPMKAAGVSPEFVISGDPQDFAGDLFNDMEIGDERLVFFRESSPLVVEKFSPANRIAADASLTYEKEFAAGETGKGELFFSGTILLPAIDLAVLSGADPVILIGADFSFDGEKTHASSSRTQGYNPRYGQLRDVAGIGGGTVKTSTIFYLYLRTVEDYCERLCGSPRIINATARGACIQDVEHATLESILEQ